MISTGSSVFVPKRIENTVLKRDLHFQVDRSIIQLPRSRSSTDLMLKKNAKMQYIHTVK